MNFSFCFTIKKDFSKNIWKHKSLSIKLVFCRQEVLIVLHQHKCYTVNKRHAVKNKTCVSIKLTCSFENGCLGIFEVLFPNFQYICKPLGILSLKPCYFVLLLFGVAGQELLLDFWLSCSSTDRYKPCHI